jgi:hypothetical protein
MSDGSQPQPAEPPVKLWHPALRVLLFLVGLILLLPGFCTLFFVYATLAGRDVPMATSSSSGLSALAFQSAGSCWFAPRYAIDHPEGLAIEVTHESRPPATTATRTACQAVASGPQGVLVSHRPRAAAPGHLHGGLHGFRTRRSHQPLAATVVALLGRFVRRRSGHSECLARSLVILKASQKK